MKAIKQLAKNGNLSAQRLAKALDYNEDQPRDEKGMWTSGIGGGGHVAATKEAFASAAKWHTEQASAARAAGSHIIAAQHEHAAKLHTFAAETSNEHTFSPGTEIMARAASRSVNPNNSTLSDPHAVHQNELMKMTPAEHIAYGRTQVGKGARGKLLKEGDVERARQHASRLPEGTTVIPGTVSARSVGEKDYSKPLPTSSNPNTTVGNSGFKAETREGLNASTATNMKQHLQAEKYHASRASAAKAAGRADEAEAHENAAHAHRNAAHTRTLMGSAKARLATKSTETFEAPPAAKNDGSARPDHSGFNRSNGRMSERDLEKAGMGWGGSKSEPSFVTAAKERVAASRAARASAPRKAVPASQSPQFHAEQQNRAEAAKSGVQLSRFSSNAKSQMEAISHSERNLPASQRSKFK